MGEPRCFHDLALCAFCWPSGRPGALTTRRSLCAACGRTVARSVGERCPACARHGFTPLRLPRILVDA